MANIEAAVQRLRVLECPAGEIGHWVSEILADCDIADKSAITVYRDHSLDKYGAQGYKVTSNNGPEIVVLTVSGMDDYVAQVIDAYVS